MFTATIYPRYSCELISAHHPRIGTYFRTNDLVFSEFLYCGALNFFREKDQQGPDPKLKMHYYQVGPRTRTFALLPQPQWHLEALLAIPDALP
jgi:hypothetical protein